MRLGHILIGSLVLAGLTFMSLLMVSENETVVQAQVDAQSPPVDEIEAQALSFDIELTATPTEVESWTELEYIIRYTVNNEAASNVVITSSVPFIAQDCGGADIFALYSYSDPPGAYSFTGQQVAWNLGAIPEGTTSEVKFAVRLPSDPFDGTTFTNQAFIQGDGVSAASEVVTATLRTNVKNALSVSPPTYVRPDDTFCVPIDFFNQGTSRDTNLIVNHQHDLAAVAFISATVPYTYQGNQITWQESCVPREVSYYNTGSYRQRYKTTLQAASSTVITVGDTITHQFTYDTDLLPPGSQNKTQFVDLGPHVSYIDWSQHVFNSTQVNFYFNFNDDTSWPLDSLDLYLRLPLNTTFVSLIETGDYRCVPPTITAQVSNDPDPLTPPPLAAPTWLPYSLGGADPHPAPGATWVHLEAGRIDWGRSFILTVDYTGLSGGTIITATGSYTSNQINGDIATPFTIPAFELYKYGPQTASAAEDMAYTVSLKNVSGAASDNVVVTDTLPAEVTFISASGNGIYDPARHQVTWNLGQMASGQQEFLKVTVNVKRGLLDKTTVLNQAEMTFDGYSGNPIKDDHSTLVRSHPTFQVTHQPEKLFVPSGALITYTVTYYNFGTGASNDALVTSLIPDKTTFVTATTPNGEVLSYDAAQIRWARPVSAPVDVAQEVQFVVRNDPPSPDGTIITNVVTISSSQSLLAIGNVSTVTVGLEPISTPEIEEDEDDDDGDIPPPSPTYTPSPPPSPTHTPTPPPPPTATPPFTMPLYLPETGQLGDGNNNTLGLGVIVASLILAGLWVRRFFEYPWPRKKG